jgi:hypothetical protein
MPGLRRRTAQIRVFEALLALTIITIALLTPKFTPTDSPQPPSSTQTILNYLVYTGILQYGLTHPVILAQTLNTITFNEPWSLSVYNCYGNTTILEEVSGEPTQAYAALAVLYNTSCNLVVLKLGVQ